MRIIRESKMTDGERISAAERMKSCDWDAGRYLGDILEKSMTKTVFGDFSEAVLLFDDSGTLAAFCTYAKQDEIDDESLTPWIGFVYTFPEYRGRRYSLLLTEHCVELARESGFTSIYVSSEETGLYEKYGFTFVKNALSVHGYETQIFRREI